MEEKLSRNDLNYETNKYIYDSQQFQRTRHFVHSIFNGKIAISEGNKKQSNLLQNISEFRSKARTKSKADKNKKNSTFKSVNPIYEGP